MSDFSFNTTASIRQMRGGAGQLGQMLIDAGMARSGDVVLFVTDPGIRALQLDQGARDSLHAEGLQVAIFDAITADPEAEAVEAAAAAARAADAQAVVGFGGGSSMDVAKVAALRAVSDQPLEQMFGVGMARGRRLPLVLVPTTAGTGSEVTPVSILTTGTEEKKGVVSPLILPDIAVLDAELTLGLPPAVTAATGVDAMVHAIEAFTSRSANNNPISRMLAVQALRLLSGNIHQVVQDGADIEAREAMLLGAMLAGQAFANSPVAAVHALAYPVGSLFKVPHGLSNALVLPAVMRFNAPACATEYAELAPHIFKDMSATGQAGVVAEELITRLDALNADLGLTGGLSGVGITGQDIARLARDAMNQTRLLVNNPRPVSEEDARAIYREAL